MEINLSDYIIGSSLKIIVKPNSKKNEIIGYDDSRKAVRIAIKAPAEDNRANKEMIKFISRLLRKKVRIMSGLKNKEKLLKIE